MVVSGKDGMNASPNITILSRPMLTKQHMLHFSCSKEENRSLFSAQQQCFQRHEVEKRALHPGELFISHHFSYWQEIKGRKDGIDFRKAFSEAKEFLFYPIKSYKQNFAQGCDLKNYAFLLRTRTQVVGDGKMSIMKESGQGDCEKETVLGEGPGELKRGSIGRSQRLSRAKSKRIQ